MKVHLIDGTFELFRHFFAVPSATAPDGTEVGATKGIIRSLCALLKQPEASHVAFSFDHVIESFRNEMFAGYKTGAGIEEGLLGQFRLAEEAAEALGIVTWRNIDFEADDAIATMAVRAAADDRVDQVVMRSPDKDLAQVIEGDRVVMYDSIRRKTMNEAGVLEKFGVAPASIPDWLGLVGDRADGIPGIPKWGAKSAGTVLARWGHVSEIPRNPAEWDIKVRGAAGLSANLEAMRGEAQLYVDLATLRYDVPLIETVDQLEWKGGNLSRMTALCARLGDNDLLERVPRWA